MVAHGVARRGHRLASTAVEASHRWLGEASSLIARRLGRSLGQVSERPQLENDELVHEAPAIVGRQSPSALAHGGG